MPSFECELVLRDNGDETRQPHMFLAEVRPGTAVHLHGRDWIVIEIHERKRGKPEVVCRT